MELSKDIYIHPPPEVNSKGVLWKLKKCVCGLADASLNWYKVKQMMLGTGGEEVDPAVLHWLKEYCKVKGLLACHVDEFLWVGTQLSTVMIPQLKSTFHVGREEHENICYVGMDIVTVDGVKAILKTCNQYTNTKRFTSVCDRKGPA